MRRLIFALMVMCLPAAMATNYCADHTKTGGGNTGVDTTNAWLTIESYIENAGISGDDTLKVRPTHLDTMKTDWSVNQPGTVNAPIVVLGDDGTVWPNDPAGYPNIRCDQYKLYHASGDHYWHYEHLTFDEYTTMAAYLLDCQGIRFSDCRITNANASNDYGIQLYRSVGVIIEDCVFDGGAIDNDDTNYGRGINAMSGGDYLIRNCSFDDFVVGVYSDNGFLELLQCRFGQDDFPNTTDAQGVNTGIRMLGGLANNTLFATGRGGSVARTYLDGSKRPMMHYKGYGWTTTADYDTVHSGGAPFSLKVTGVTNTVGYIRPVKILDYGVHADSGQSLDFTISGYRAVTWGSAPTAAQLYVEASYWDADTIATAQSTAVLTNASEWVSLTVSGVTPNHKGTVQVALWLACYDTDGVLYFDPELVVPGNDYNAISWWGLPFLAYDYTAPSGGQIIIIH